MSVKIDQFCDVMQTKLNAIEAQIERVKADVNSAGKEGLALFDSKLAEARAVVESQRNHVEAAGIKVRHWAVAKREAGEAVIAGWKGDIDRTKLEVHAERAEASARSSVVIAEAALADANLATYEAIAARRHADGTH